MPVIIIIAIVLIIVLIYLLVQYWYIALAVALIVAAAIIVPRIVRRARKNRYFASEEFQARKNAITALVAEHNAIADYTREMRQANSFAVGRSSTGAQSHLATYENTSRHGYRRDRNVADFSARNVHNCSLQVVRNAKADPIKYVMKYFGIASSDESLVEVEGLGQSISRLEDAVANLETREKAITTSLAPPAFILKHYEKEFMDQVGVELSPVSVPYPNYVFEYVSAGGNSSQKTSVTLTTEVIDALMERISDKVRFAKSAAGQRALMTAKLRHFIKSRDDFTCRSCFVSVMREPTLLLEVDHILPVSRGGLSTVDNLQTLCWRCNRSKSNKIAV